MEREIIRQSELNKNMDKYWLKDGTELDPLLVQAIIDKYISLKFHHLLQGHIIREDYTGEVRLIVRRYTQAQYVGAGSQYDVIVSSTGWRISKELVDIIDEEVARDPKYLDRFK